MKHPKRIVNLGSLFLGVLVSSLLAPSARAAEGEAVRTLNTPRTFPEIPTRADWESRAQEIRQQVLVSCGLWPLPAKTPLNPQIFGRIERDGYSVEKVYLETYPGFYLAGNLYRPLGQGRGPFPGILNPHGHWSNGRVADTKEGSVAARCISFARQGMVAFAYDMVGYNDTQFSGAAPNRPFYETHRQFGTNRTDQLWNISLMGLQTWNSIRALDFLASLPDVDKKRLACTGASGGGTQTFMLGAIEDRFAALAPAVMVSHSMQGGCSCENAPGLRVQYSNMEIAAAAAPCPQILVAATGDWTKATLEVEGPAIENIYRLLGASDRLRYVIFDYGHNYNQTSREAVYEWFGQWLLRHPDPASLKELPYLKEPDADLRVFPDGKLPANALSRDEFNESLKAMYREQWRKLVPRNQAGVAKFRQVMLPAWKHTLQVEWPGLVVETKLRALRRDSAWSGSEMVIHREGEEQALTAVCFTPRVRSASRIKNLVVLANADDADAYLGTDGEPLGLAASLLERGQAVMVLQAYSSGEPTNQFANFFTTYNRTKLQSRVRDLVTAGAAGRALVFGGRRDGKVVLHGVGRAGLWALLAAPAVDAVVADGNALEIASDEVLLEADFFCPGLRNIGTFEGAAMLAAPNPLLLHNTGGVFPTTSIQSAYKAISASRKLRVLTEPAPEEAVVNWLSRL
ncbi:MAG: acetylxylan esterase [Verrucomicrobia bacterium]|nr:acetylxylan esterase [Verrucomicrobiota bacterium]